MNNPDVMIERGRENNHFRMSNPDLMIERGRENNNLSWVINDKALTTVKCLANVCEICQ